MEHKENRRLLAHTYVPSVERFSDFRTLTRLPTKARDFETTSLQNGRSLFKREPSKISQSGGSTPLPTKGAMSDEKIRPDRLAVKFLCQIASESITKNSIRPAFTADVSNVGYRGEDKSSPPTFSQELKSSAGKRSPLSKPTLLGDQQRKMTPISDYPYKSKPALPLESQEHDRSEQQLMKEYSSRSEPYKSASVKAKPDVKVTTQPARFFPTQSERRPMKSERNRGNQKLPVGIAFAQKRQQQQVAPAKPTTLVKNVSPDLDRRYHKHSLNREREVLLRDDMELSKYTSKLATVSSSPTMSMSKPSNAILPESWEGEAYMSMLHQWQARQQSSPMGSGLQHPSMWFGGGTPPYLLTGNQTASNLCLAQSSLLWSGFPVGFTLTPQHLQEVAAGSMWQSLANFYGSLQATPHELQNPFRTMLAQKLADLQHLELQALQQQAMLHFGKPFSLCKTDTLPSDVYCCSHGSSSQFHMKKCSTDSGDKQHHSPSRLPVSPKELKRQALSEDHDHSVSVHSPPRPVAPLQSTVIGSHATPLSFDKKLGHVLVSENDADIRPTRQSCAKAEKNDAVRATPPAKPVSPGPLLMEYTRYNGNDFRDGKVSEKNESSKFAKPANIPDKNLPHDATEKCPVLWKSAESFGVELLSKAVDIYLENLNTGQHVSNSAENDSSSSPRPFSNLQCHSGKVLATEHEPKKESLTETLENASDPIDVLAMDPVILGAVQGITLLSQSASRNRYKQNSMPPTRVSSTSSCHHAHSLATSVCSCNANVQSTVSCSSALGSATVSGDFASSNETKNGECSKRMKLKRRLNKRIFAKLKLLKGEKALAGTSFVEMDNMDAREIDMKVRMAKLQRQYKEKQKELAEIERKSKRLKLDSNISSSTASSAATVNASSHFASSTFKFGEMSALSSSQLAWKKDTVTKKRPISGSKLSSKRRKTSDNYEEGDLPEGPNSLKHKSVVEPMLGCYDGESIFEKFAAELSTMEKINGEKPSFKDERDAALLSNPQPIPSGSRRRKLDKPKRICLAPEGPAVAEPLSDPGMKALCIFDLHKNQKSASDNSSPAKTGKRKMELATKKIVLTKDGVGGGWRVFKSKNKSEKLDQKARKRSEEKTKHRPTKSRSENLTNDKKRKISLSLASESVEPLKEVENFEETEGSGTFRLELKEEDLVKGLQVLVPLEDKLLYPCQVNPIQPPDIYELTVEGERNRHRSIVMCLEQIMKDAVPEVKLKSADDLCEGSRVAAYWSRKMHCLYAGTITFDDSDKNQKEGLIRVEFDDGDSSTIPLEDIRLLPKNYPVVRSDAPFLMSFVHRRRNSFDMLGKEGAKTSSNTSKKPAAGRKKEKGTKKSGKLSSGLRRMSLDMGTQDYPSADGRDRLVPTPRKRSSSTKVERLASKQIELSSSSVSSADDDSDTLLSDSSDDTYDGDHDAIARILPKSNGNLQRIYRRMNRLWSWHDEDVQKKAAKGRAKKIYHKSIVRGDEFISCGDSAVFLSPGCPHLSYVGKIEAMWESWGDNMVVKVRWFYHPEETKTGRLKSHGKHPLYKSSHIDENDIQTISHKCEVVSLKEYGRRMRNGEQNVFYCTGTYEPATGQVVHEYTDKKKHH